MSPANLQGNSDIGRSNITYLRRFRWISKQLAQHSTAKRGLKNLENHKNQYSLYIQTTKWLLKMSEVTLYKSCNFRHIVILTFVCRGLLLQTLLLHLLVYRFCNFKDIRSPTDVNLFQNELTIFSYFNDIACSMKIIERKYEQTFSKSVILSDLVHSFSLSKYFQFPN